MAEITFEFACDEVTGDDTPGFAIHHHQVHHLMTVVHLYHAQLDLAAKGRICSKQKLLARLPAGKKGP